MNSSTDYADYTERQLATKRHKSRKTTFAENESLVLILFVLIVSFRGFLFFPICVIRVFCEYLSRLISHSIPIVITNPIATIDRRTNVCPTRCAARAPKYPPSNAATAIKRDRGHETKWVIENAITATLLMQMPRKFLMPFAR